MIDEMVADLKKEQEDEFKHQQFCAAELAENVQLKRAGEDRVLANKEFQRTIQDQRATQLILKKVMARLEKVYQAPPPPEANETANATEVVEPEPAFFLQRQLHTAHHKQMPTFGAYGKNDEGG